MNGHFPEGFWWKTSKIIREWRPLSENYFARVVLISLMSDGFLSDRVFEHDSPNTTSLVNTSFREKYILFTHLKNSYFVSGLR
jgi:hypothetical protein